MARRIAILLAVTLVSCNLLGVHQTLSRDAGERERVMKRWGMIPHFATSRKEYLGVSSINAKAENLMTSGTGRVPCLMLDMATIAKI